jgi:hypothetical protein
MRNDLDGALPGSLVLSGRASEATMSVSTQVCVDLLHNTSNEKKQTDRHFASSMHVQGFRRQPICFALVEHSMFPESI